KSQGVLPGIAEALQNDKEVLIRRTAALTLGAMGPAAKDAIGALAGALKGDKSEKVREAAAQALGRMVPHSKSVVPVLAQGLRDSHPETRAAAAETLRELGEDALPALGPLTEAVQDPKADRFTRIYCAQALSRLGGEGAAAVPALAKVLAEKDADPKVREAAA